MKILTRYVLREHLGPLVFALTALTSLLMLQFVARQLGNFVGKGVPWRVIGEFFVLSLPFTVAMTLPMAVLVATLHAFGRMAAEHEITAFKANGVKVSTLMWPVILAAGVLAAGMVVFNDQVLPRANHRLRVLQQDMARTKPTLLLNEQTLNSVTSSFYMRIGKLDRESNKMTDVTIYDLSEPLNRKTIYADSGDLATTPDKKDLQLVLFDGYSQQLEGSDKHGLRRQYFRSQAVRVKDVGGDFEQTGNDEWKGDREKSICEMQSEYVANAREYERARQQYIEVASSNALPGQKTVTVPRPRPPTQGLARLYCNGLALVFRLPTAVPSMTPPLQPTTVAASVPSQAIPGTAAGDSAAIAAVPEMSASMLAQLEAAKASIAGSQQTEDTAAIRIASEAAAQRARQTVVASAVLSSATGDSAKATVVPVTGSDSTAPGSVPPATATVGSGTTAANVPPAVVPPAASSTPPTAAQVAAQVAAAQAAATQAVPVPRPAAPAVSFDPSYIAPGNVAVGSAAPPPVTRAPQAMPGAAAAHAFPGQPGALPPSIITPSVGSSGRGAVPDVGAIAVVPGAAGAPPASPVESALNSELVKGGQAELNAADGQLQLIRSGMDSLSVEIQKKFALSFACIVFVLFGPPIALRFPRGGVGATLGVSLLVFGVYYVFLVAGETLADDGKLPPIIAMWIANVLFTIVGVLLLLRIEKTADASRGGGVRGWLDDRKARRRAKTMRLTVPTTAT